MSKRMHQEPEPDQPARPDLPPADRGPRKGTGFFAVMGSVFAGLIGVQSSKNRKRDFTEGKPIHFIVGGLVGTLVFLFAIWLLVQYLLATA